jgi:hypothetical protein
MTNPEQQPDTLDDTQRNLGARAPGDELAPTDTPEEGGALERALA